jgi:hypothetical protein
VSKLVELRSPDGKTTILIESSDATRGGVGQASGHLEKQFDKMLERITPFCEAILENFRQLKVKPDSASAEFGLSVTAEGNIFVVKAAGEASFKFSLNWNNLRSD